MKLFIREQREKKGFTQKQLAERLGYKSASTVSMWEYGDRIPSILDYFRMKEIFKCTDNELIYISKEDIK